MATALKSKSPKPRSRRQDRRSQSRQQPHLHAVGSPNQPASGYRRSSTPVFPAPGSTPAIRQLPAKRSYPLWLRLLIQLQRGSLIVTFILVTAALVVYGSTMYLQQLWSKEYRKLKTMQRSERQMLAAEGFLKNQIIQQAEQPGSGLVPKTPEHTIYLPSAPPRPAPPVNPIILKSEPSQGGEALGY